MQDVCMTRECVVQDSMRCDSELHYDFVDEFSWSRVLHITLSSLAHLSQCAIQLKR